MLAQYLLGTVHIAMNQFTEAGKYFEAALSLAINIINAASEKKEQCTIVLKDIKLAYSMVLVRANDQKRALENLADVLEEDPNCLYALVEVARITEYYDFEKALDHYLRALKILESESEKNRAGKDEKEWRFSDIVSPNIYNNISVLYANLNNLAEAK